MCSATLALLLGLFTHVLTERVSSTVAPVLLRPVLYGTALFLGVLAMRGAGNTLRTAGSVSASNARLVVAAFAGSAIIFASALGIFSLFALANHVFD